MPDTDHTKLKGAFGEKGTQSNAISYGHPYGAQILEEARQVIAESKTGQIFLRVMDHHKIPVHIIKGTGESGFSPDMKTIFLQVPGNATGATGDSVLHLVKALREADQEYSGHKAPDPMKDVMEYAAFIHARNLDSITHVCMVVKELTNSSYFSDLLDTLSNLGLNGVYKAYLAGASKEELYVEYASAYNSTDRG